MPMLIPILTIALSVLPLVACVLLTIRLRKLSARVGELDTSVFGLMLLGQANAQGDKSRADAIMASARAAASNADRLGRLETEMNAALAILGKMESARKLTRPN